MERERDERLEPAGLVLQRARAQHVIDALLHRLDVPVQHRHVGAHAEPVGEAMDVEVAVRAALVVADLLSHAFGENLGAAARQRVEAGALQFAQHLFVGHPVEIGEERDLHRREALQVDAGPDAFEPAQHVQVVVERQLGVEAVDDVDFGERLGGAAAAACPRSARATSCTTRDRPACSRANEQNRQLATQTLVASTLMLKL